MGRIGVTFEEFVVVARQLHAQRQTVTVDRVREVLGRGSRTTLLKHLQQWRHELATLSPSFDLADLPTSLLPLIEAFWRRAGEEAAAQLADERNRLEQERQTLRERDHVREGQLQVLTEQLASLQHRERQLSQELTAVTEALGRSQVENLQLNQTAQQSQQESRALATKLQQAELSLTEHTKTSAAQLASERARHDSELARWLQQLDATRQQLRELAERCALLEKQRTVAAQAPKSTSKRQRVTVPESDAVNTKRSSSKPARTRRSR
ncbi:hypothetical protein HPT27_12915 [Permianibacter sp. IMCC34836]|uniref:DNA-binding protein n=1 Tax=Permianibacter fluminis TaxID=2738515 RepID=UPI0015540EFF|nr:DNA-binding protein [Permianibacter fluminis]NQD37925.1 hypothetical protein [Permianibacter fluminis]